MGFASLYPSTISARRANHSKPVQSRCEKFSACPVGQISDLTPRVSPERGAARDRHETRGGMRWTRKLRLTSAADADGEVVWSWRPDAGVKLAGSIPPMTVARKPVHRGEHEVSRKPLRREGRMPPLNLYARVRFLLCTLHTRPRVQRASGLPCALCFQGRNFPATTRAHGAAGSRSRISQPLNARQYPNRAAPSGD